MSQNFLSPQALTAADLTTGTGTADEARLRQPAQHVSVLFGSWPTRNNQTLVLAHPVASALVGSVIFLLALLFPPTLYTDLLGDKCYMFLSPKLAAFNGACILMVFAGLYVAFRGSLTDASAEWSFGPKHAGHPLTVACLLLGIIALNILAVAMFARSGGIASLMAALRGSVLLKTELHTLKETTDGAPWKGLMLISSVSLPAAWHMSRSFDRRSAITWLLILAVLTFIPGALITAKRNFFTRPLFAALLMFLAFPIGRRVLSRARAALVCVALAFAVIVGFLSLASLREGIDGTTEATAEIVRYLIGPYNTEALIVDGRMDVPGSGKGFYWTQWFWEFPVANKILNLEKLRDRILGDKAPYGHEERGPIMQHHGLSVGTAMPAFACSYVDFGWFGVFPFFVVGMATGWLWNSFLSQQHLGLFFYPMAAYSFVEWRGNLIFPSIQISYCLLVFLTVAAAAALEEHLRHRSA